MLRDAILVNQYSPVKKIRLKVRRLGTGGLCAWLRRASAPSGSATQGLNSGEPGCKSVCSLAIGDRAKHRQDFSVSVRRNNLAGI